MPRRRTARKSGRRNSRRVSRKVSKSSKKLGRVTRGSVRRSARRVSRRSRRNTKRNTRRNNRRRNTRRVKGGAGGSVSEGSYRAVPYGKSRYGKSRQVKNKPYLFIINASPDISVLSDLKSAYDQKKTEKVPFIVGMSVDYNGLTFEDNDDLYTKPANIRPIHSNSTIFNGKHVTNINTFKNACNEVSKTLEEIYSFINANGIKLLISALPRAARVLHLEKTTLREEELIKNLEEGSEFTSAEQRDAAAAEAAEADAKDPSPSPYNGKVRFYRGATDTSTPPFDFMGRTPKQHASSDPIIGSLYYPLFQEAYEHFGNGITFDDALGIYTPYGATFGADVLSLVSMIDFIENTFLDENDSPPEYWKQMSIGQIELKSMIFSQKKQILGFNQNPGDRYTACSCELLDIPNNVFVLNPTDITQTAACSKNVRIVLERVYRDKRYQMEGLIDGAMFEEDPNVNDVDDLACKLLAGYLIPGFVGIDSRQVCIRL